VDPVLSSYYGVVVAGDGGDGGRSLLGWVMGQRKGQMVVVVCV